MLKHLLSALTQSSSRREGLGIHWPECHEATSHLAMGALSGPGAATPRGHHTRMVASLGLGARFTKSQDFCGGWYRRLMEFSTHFTKCLPLNSLLLFLILQQDFCTKMVMVLGRGEEREHIFC